MSSFLGAGLAWLETDETPAATATAAMSVTTAKPRSNPRIGSPLVVTRHRVAAAGGAPGPGVSIGDDPPGKVKPAGTGSIGFARSTQRSPRSRAAQLELPRCERPGSPQRARSRSRGYL